MPKIEVDIQKRGRNTKSQNIDFTLNFASLTFFTTSNILTFNRPQVTRNDAYTRHYGQKKVKK